MNQQYDKNHLSIKWACKKKKNGLNKNVIS